MKIRDRHELQTRGYKEGFGVGFMVDGMKGAHCGISEQHALWEGKWSRDQLLGEMQGTSKYCLKTREFPINYLSWINSSHSRASSLSLTPPCQL